MRTKFFLIYSLVLLAGFGAPVARAAEVLGVRLGIHDGFTRVVVDLSSPTSLRVDPSTAPGVLLLWVGATVGDPAPTPPPAGGAVRSVSLRSEGGGTVVRVVHAAERVGEPFNLRAEGDEPPRWVVDLQGGVQDGTGLPSDQLAELDRSRREAPYVVVIDAGHGGSDLGTRGVGVALEKDVVLGIARSMAALLEGHPGIEVLLTRADDRFVPLSGRVELARSAAGDLFLSIHANSAPNHGARGAEVYFLSLDGASDEAAQVSEDRENAAWRVGVEGDALEDDDLWSILVDLRQSSTLQHSSRLAEIVLETLRGEGSAVGRAVKQANFVVLRTLSMPAILVEAGFLSHPAEARELANPERQARLGLALAVSVVEYLGRHGEKRRLEPLPRPSVHTVGRGDTLVALARRLGVDAARLRAVNALRGDALWVGQQLLVP